MEDFARIPEVNKRKHSAKMTTLLKEPHAIKAKVMLWRDISYHDMEIIDQIKAVPDLESTLCRLFGLDLPEPKRGVVVELYVQAVLFGRKQSFKKEQTSSLLSIIKSIHEANVGNLLKDEDECFHYCVELLLCHSVRRPPFSISIFTYEEANSILKYLDAVYLKHCKLYKYIFTPQWP
ncbi:coiled-coil domain-containing protein 189 isoform X2 [Oryzias melastigma]|uniref:coiled-coil domain-containing protein 189 isoform X2 n=1 Tax=Oryzias melastigma TaxID=30732 RepID=UPI000CF8124E|nr:coiled-coil domain-containing protein 189 isoform X2 [Oryzias melastigma]